MEKYFKDTEYIELTHENAMKLCAENPQFVMSRNDWTGYHFIKNERYYMLLKPCIYRTVDDKPINVILDCGPISGSYEELKDKVYNIDDMDWIVAYRSSDGQLAEIEAITMEYYLYHKLLDEGAIIYPIEVEATEVKDEENIEEQE